MIPAIKKRHSIRQYKKKEVPEEMVKDILKAGMFAPSAKNQRSWEFIIVKDTKKLVPLTIWTLPLKTAPLAIVVIADKNKSSHWVEDCSAAVENMMLQATEIGLGTCWVQIHSSSTKNAEANIKKMLGIPGNYGVLCMMALGFPDVKKAGHSEEEFEKFRIHDEKF